MSKIKFELIRGSDLLRDGMYLELSVSETSPLRQVAEVSYSDVTHEFFLTCYEENIPLEAVEKLILEARISHSTNEARTIKIYIARTTYQAPLLAQSAHPPLDRRLRAKSGWRLRLWELDEDRHRERYLFEQCIKFIRKINKGSTHKEISSFSSMFFK